MSKHPSRWNRALLESAVIVGSILLAFAIDASWERYQEALDRAELIDALQLDFQTTAERLDSVLLRADTIVDKNRAALLVATQGQRLPIDSLRALVDGFFHDITFVTNLPAYEAAVRDGGIGALESRPFLDADASFRQAQEFYLLNSEIAAELYYLGPTANLIRRELGSLGVLLTPPAECFSEYNCPYPATFDRSAGEILDFVQRRDVYAALENIHNVNLNSRRSLMRMAESVDGILDVLESLEAGTTPP